MSRRFRGGLCCAQNTLLCVVALLLGTRCFVGGETASTSKDFFFLLARPDVLNIVLGKDIALDLKDAPHEPLNLTRSVSITSGAPAPIVTRLAANYISNKIRLKPNVTITFDRIILTGILRGTGQHLDLLSRSDGGAVVYLNTINHRGACLPFEQFYSILASLPPPLESAGMAGQPVGAIRNFSVRSSPLCWSPMSGDKPCMSPHLDMISYGAYNEVTDVLIPPNGGYNSFFVNSYGVCDAPVSYECLQQRGADLCLAAALTSAASASSGGGEQESGQSVALAMGLGVGLGGALLLAVLLIVIFARSHWRHRKAAIAAGGSEVSKRSMHAQGQSSSSTHPGAAAGPAGVGGASSVHTDLEKGSDGAVLLDVAAESGSAAPGEGEGLGAAATGGVWPAGGSGGKGALRPGALARANAGGSVSSSSSGVTMEGSSMTAVYRKGTLGDGGSSPGLGEVEVARMNLMANAARGRVGRTAPLEVKVLQLLGQGSFGKVYKGVWHGTLVALKAQVLPPSLSGDARRRHMAVMEAAISSAINHPAIVQTYCYSFRPIRDNVSRAVIKHARSALPGEELGGRDTGGPDTPAEENGGPGPACTALPADEDYGHELLLVLEYCDGGSLRTALDKGTFHRGRPWAWDWRRAIQELAAAGGPGTAGRAAAAPQHGQLQIVPPGAAAAVSAVPPPPLNTPDGNTQRSPASTNTDGRVVAAVPEDPATVKPPPTALLVAPPAPASSASRARTVHATELPSECWPKLSTYEPDFTQGPFEVLVPASANQPATEGKGNGEVNGKGNGTGVEKLPSGAHVTWNSFVATATAAADGGGDGAPPHIVPQKDMFAGAPTADLSYVSSFSAASAGDNAAAAAAADRLAMTYLLQRAAAAIEMQGPPGAAGGYAKILADYISASNLTRGLGMTNSFSGLATSEAEAAILGGLKKGTAGGGGVGSHSSEDTLVAPPPAVLSAAAAVAAAAGSGSQGSGGGGAAAAAGAAAVAMGGGSTGGEGPGDDSGKPGPAILYGLMLAVATDVASGLLHLHAHGVVHGDVKASNVLLKQIVVSDPWEAAGRVLDPRGSATGHPGTGTGPTPAADRAAPRPAHYGAAGACGGPSSAAPGDPATCSPQQPQTLMHPPRFTGDRQGQGHSHVLLGGSAGVELQESSGPRLGLCAKVADFGLSTMLSASNTDTHISATTAAGSLSHMSPELLLCGHVSKANDVYAYGILLFELFTGERAWEGMPRALLPARVALEGWRPVFPPHTPPGYRQLAERCWVADPAKRPTFDEIVSAIRRLRDTARASDLGDWLPVPNPQLAFLQQLMQQRTRPGAGAAAGGAAGGGGGGVGGVGAGGQQTLRGRQDSPMLQPPLPLALQPQQQAALAHHEQQQQKQLLLQQHHRHHQQQHQPHQPQQQH